MKIIRVTTDLEVTAHDFPVGTMAEQSEALRELIGNECDYFEHVMPGRLYSELEMENKPTSVSGECVSMLVDEEGLLKANRINLIGSYLYEYDEYEQPIMGDILFVGEEWTEDGIRFCGIENYTFEVLFTELKNMAIAMKATKEALGV